MTSNTIIELKEIRNNFVKDWLKIFPNDNCESFFDPTLFDETLEELNNLRKELGVKTK